MYKPPQKVKQNAKIALNCISNGSDAMTRVGRQTARLLASGKPVSKSKLKQISKFNRHRKNKTVPSGVKPCDDNGYVAWKGWGGDAGVRWAKSKLKNGRK